MTQASERHFYSVAQAAEQLGVSPSTVWRWIEAERLPAYRVGPKNIRIKKEDIDRVVQPARPPRQGEPMQERRAAATALSVHPLDEEERRRGLEALRAAKQLRDRILARRGGEPLPSSWELIREAREERDAQL
jgi:excisionase family DNA binding protein